MAQFARPDGDTQLDEWQDQAAGTSNLFQAIDETSPSDSDFVRQGNNNTNDLYQGTLSNVSDPGVHTGHVVRYRYGKDAAAGNARNVNVVLLQGATTVIANQTHTDIGSGFTDGSFTLSEGEAANITDYSALQFRFEASGTTGGAAGSRRAVQVSWFELEVPDAVVPIDGEVTESGEADEAMVASILSPQAYAEQADADMNAIAEMILQAALTEGGESGESAAYPVESTGATWTADGMTFYPAEGQTWTADGVTFHTPEAGTASVQGTVTEGAESGDAVVAMLVAQASVTEGADAPIGEGDNWFVSDLLRPVATIEDAVSGPGGADWTGPATLIAGASVTEAADSGESSIAVGILGAVVTEDAESSDTPGGTVDEVSLIASMTADGVTFGPGTPEGAVFTVDGVTYVLPGVFGATNVVEGARSGDSWSAIGAPELGSVSEGAYSNKLVIPPQTLPDAEVGVPYSQTLYYQGGVEPVTWSLDSGSLPAGLSLSDQFNVTTEQTEALISGTPTTSGSLNPVFRADGQVEYAVETGFIGASTFDIQETIDAYVKSIVTLSAVTEATESDEAKAGILIAKASVTEAAESSDAWLTTAVLVTLASDGAESDETWTGTVATGEIAAFVTESAESDDTWTVEAILVGLATEAAESDDALTGTVLGELLGLVTESAESGETSIGILTANVATIEAAESDEQQVSLAVAGGTIVEAAESSESMVGITVLVSSLTEPAESSDTLTADVGLVGGVTENAESGETWTSVSILFGLTSDAAESSDEYSGFGPSLVEVTEGALSQESFAKTVNYASQTVDDAVSGPFEFDDPTIGILGVSAEAAESDETWAVEAMLRGLASDAAESGDVWLGITTLIVGVSEAAESGESWQFGPFVIVPGMEFEANDGRLHWEANVGMQFEATDDVG